MDIVTQLDGDEMRVTLNGRLDAAWSNAVNDTLQDVLRNGSHQIALDLEQVSYLSSAGIRVLLMLHRSLKSINGTLRLINPSVAVSDVLNLVGFNQLLETAPATQQTTEQPGIKVQACHLAGNDFSVHLLDETACQQGTVIKESTIISLTERAWAIGHGVIGGSVDTGPSGELLAAAGLAINLPTNDPEHHDWMQQEGGMTPEISLLHGLSGTGDYRYLMRFGETPAMPPLRLSELAKAALEQCASDTVAWVIIAETAQLVGAALQVSQSAITDDFFAYPAIRDRLLFTAEPAFTAETCLIVGVIARKPSMPLADQLRPHTDDSDLFMHHHAAIVPFYPVRKGYITLHDGLARLLDTQTIRGVLHLLNDDREGVGAGESYLRRGAIWCAPITFNAEDIL